MNWKDATSYSQGERGKAPQTAWQTSDAGVSIWVSCGHVYAPGQWVMTSRELGIDVRTLSLREDASSEEARDAAVQEAWVKAKAIQAKMGSVADTLFATPKLSK